MKRNLAMILATALIMSLAIVALAQGPGAPPRGPEMESVLAGPPDGPPMPDMDAGELLDDPMGPPPQDFGPPPQLAMAKEPGMPAMPPGGPDMAPPPPPPPGHCHMGPPPPPRGGHWEFFAKMLGLTDEQKKETRTLKVNFLERSRKARMALASLRDERHTMMMSGKIDETKLAKIDEDTVKAESELMKERLKMRRDRLALLTQDQITRLAEMIMERPGHGGHHGKMR